MSPAAATRARPDRVATDPRLRARQAEVARAAGRRRLAAVTAVLVAAASVVTVLVLLHSSLVSARVVRIAGGPHEGRAEILAVTGLSARPPLIDVSTGADARALERLPWVASARVVRDWPTGVSVTLTERRPAAEVPLGGKVVALVDRTGRVLDTTASPPAGLVVVTGVGPVGRPGTRLAGAPAVLAVAAALPGSLSSRVTDLSTVRGEGVVAHLAKGPAVVLGTATSLPAKMVALATVLAKVPLHGIVTIDLRVPAEPVLTR